jgi:hypothetical protein
LNIEPNRVWGYITTAEGEYYIEPLNRFFDEAAEGSYILYNAHDVITTEEISCGADAQSEKVKNAQSFQGVPKAGDDCRKLEIATESDFEMFDAGTNFNDILGNLNLVEDVYETYYAMEFLVTYQHEWATAADPYNTTESGCGGFGMLSIFAAEWRTNFGFVRRDINVLYSRKDFDLNTIGCASTGAFGDGSENDGVLLSSGISRGAYSVNQWEFGDFFFPTSDSERRTLVAHEMGHNFGAVHDTIDCNNIMCNSINSSSVFFSTAQNQMNATMNVESAAANDGRSALRERYLEPFENFLSNPPTGSTESANILIIDGLIFPTTVSGSNTVQYNGSEEIRLNPGTAVVPINDATKIRFDIAPCSINSIIPNTGEEIATVSHPNQTTSLNRNGRDTGVALYPNPTNANSFLKLESELEELAIISLIDGLGREVFQSAEMLVKGVNLIEVQSQKLDQGLYFINLRLARGESKTIKLQKID